MAMKKKAQKAPAKKKPTPTEVQSKRMKELARSEEYKKYRQTSAASRRYEDEMYLRSLKPGYGEGGFWSEGLQRKASLDYEKERIKELKQAKSSMKQGVTKSGGYVGGKSLLRGAGGGYDIQDVRKANRSDKYKGEQAVKNSGGSLTRNARGKTTKRNAK